MKTTTPPVLEYCGSECARYCLRCNAVLSEESARCQRCGKKYSAERRRSYHMKNVHIVIFLLVHIGRRSTILLIAGCVLYVWSFRSFGGLDELPFWLSLLFVGATLFLAALRFVHAAILALTKVIDVSLFLETCRAMVLFVVILGAAYCLMAAQVGPKVCFWLSKGEMEALVVQVRSGGTTEPRPVGIYFARSIREEDGVVIFETIGHGLTGTSTASGFANISAGKKVDPSYVKIDGDWYWWSED